MQIDYRSRLNEAQYEAATHRGSPLLVIAGAGSGKTRTIVYRLARLVEEGVPPESILLLTFTRKASFEMVSRASTLLGRGLASVPGGTFHSFAFATLRRHAAELGVNPAFTVLDKADASSLAKDARDRLELGKGDKSFPKKDTLVEVVSKARNKELNVSDLVSREYPHLLPYCEDLEEIAHAYRNLKRNHGLFDYDDLLFELERLLLANPKVLETVRRRFNHVMVDEFQDTNLVQARLVKLIAGDHGEVAAVGDDAQSIYAFRGANVANILRFGEEFPGARVVRLERNYRSTQPILDLTNTILENAREKYDKHLYTERATSHRPRVYRTHSDASQARAVLQRVSELKREHGLDTGDIAVLFRAGFMSYLLEVELNKLGFPFVKYGGIKFTEAAHIKDALAYMRLACNPSDLAAWNRALGHVKGVGPKTVPKVIEAVLRGDADWLAKRTAKNQQLGDLLRFLDTLRRDPGRPAHALEAIAEFYLPILRRAYPDDYPRRQQGLDELASIASGYQDCPSFLADVSLENPGEEREAPPEDALVLSTIHSAKGLQFKAVMVLDLAEERFPGKRAMHRMEDMEEERRLMYVACTRAMDHLDLFVPEAVWVRHLERNEPVRPSPFVTELPAELYDDYRETFGGGFEKARPRGMPEPATSAPTTGGPAKGGDGGALPMGYCRHAIYGRGKIIQHIPPDKYRVNFQDFGLKVIVGRFLEPEE